METRLPMSAIQNVFATCPKLDFFKNAHIPLFILQYKLTFFLCIYIYLYIYIYVYIYIYIYIYILLSRHFKKIVNILDSLILILVQWIYRFSLLGFIGMINWISNHVMLQQTVYFIWQLLFWISSWLKHMVYFQW